MSIWASYFQFHYNSYNTNFKSKILIYIVLSTIGCVQPDAAHYPNTTQGIIFPALPLHILKLSKCLNTLFLMCYMPEYPVSVMTSTHNDFQVCTKPTTITHWHVSVPWNCHLYIILFLSMHLPHSTLLTIKFQWVFVYED